MRLLILALFAGVAQCCVDLLFVLDGPKHKDHALLVAKSLQLSKGEQEATIIIQKKRELAAKKVTSTTQLRTSIEQVRLQQPLNITIPLAYEQVAERTSTRPIVVLIFTDRELDREHRQKFFFASNYHKIHVFVMRTDQLQKRPVDRSAAQYAAEDVLGNGRDSLEAVLQCGKKKVEKKEIVQPKPFTSRPQQQRKRDEVKKAINQEVTVTTKRSGFVAFTKTTRAPRVTTERTTPSLTKRTVLFTRRPRVNTEAPPTIAFEESFNNEVQKTTKATPKPFRRIRFPPADYIDVVRFDEEKTTKATPKPFHSFTRATQRATQQESEEITRRPFGSFRSNRVSSTRRVIHTEATTTTTELPTTRPPPGCQADVIFLMDFSGGTEEKTQQYLKIAEDIARNLPVEENLVRIGMIRYSGPGRQESLFHLKTHKTNEAVIAAIRGAQHMGGTTRTGEALAYAEKDFHRFKGGRKDVKKVVVLFTDGWSQEDPSVSAAQLRRSGVSIFVVAVPDIHLNPNIEEMREITGDANNIFLQPEGSTIRSKIVSGCRL